MENGSIFVFVAVVAIVSIIVAVMSQSKTQKQDEVIVTNLLNNSESTLEERISYLRGISGKVISPNLARLSLGKAIDTLTIDIGNERMQEEFLKYVNSTFKTPEFQQICYSSVHSTLLKNMLVVTPSVKMFFLNLARWHYAAKRPNGVLTIYDEQAIQNDLATLSVG